MTFAQLDSTLQSGASGRGTSYRPFLPRVATSFPVLGVHELTITTSKSTAKTRTFPLRDSAINRFAFHASSARLRLPRFGLTISRGNEYTRNGNVRTTATVATPPTKVCRNERRFMLAILALLLCAVPSFSRACHGQCSHDKKCQERCLKAQHCPAVNR